MLQPKASTLLCLPLLFLFCSSTSAAQCGRQARGTVCSKSLCCSQYGYCGTTSPYCGSGCQSGRCSRASPSKRPLASNSTAVARIITSGVFNQFLSKRTASGCPSKGFYTYKAFLTAASTKSAFGTTGSEDVAKRELAAFFANVAHETGSGCYVNEIVKGTYCDPSSEWPCAPGKQYFGRGPIQLSWNFNYGPAGKAIGFDGINHPEIVAQNAIISFKTAVWYWMTQGSPTSHVAMVKNVGFGATIQAINGGLECGSGANLAEQHNRIKFYKKFCSALNVNPGDRLSC